MTKAQVRAQQRSRLLEALIDTCGGKGVNEATVSDVIAKAGVSRKTYYEHFADRRTGALVAEHAALTRAIEPLQAALAGSERNRVQRLATTLAAALKLARSRPAACHLVLKEIAAAGAEGVERRVHIGERAGSELQQLLGRPALPTALAQMLAGGLLRIVDARASTARASTIDQLAQDLARLVFSYHPVPVRLARGQSAGAAATAIASTAGGRAPGTLSLGSQRLRAAHHGGSRSFRGHSQHERVMDAVTQLLAETDYATLTIDNIAAFAGVSPNSIYQRFEDKQDALLVSHEVGFVRALGLVERALSAARDWPSGVSAGVASLLGFFAGEPAFANLALVQAPVATPTSARRAALYATVSARLLLEGKPADPRGESPHKLIEELVAGAIAETLFQAAARREIHRVTERGAYVTYLVLAPYIGRGAAARAALAPPR